MWHELSARRDKAVIYLVPPEQFQRQEFFARLWPFPTVIDWRQQFLETQVRPAQAFLNVSVESELKRLRTIGDSASKFFCFINNEYLLARWKTSQREQFWFALWNNFPHLQGIIVFTVLNTPELLPSKMELEQWRKHGRLFSPADFLTETQHDENQGTGFGKRASDFS